MDTQRKKKQKLIINRIDSPATLTSTPKLTPPPKSVSTRSMTEAYNDITHTNLKEIEETRKKLKQSI